LAQDKTEIIPKTQGGDIFTLRLNSDIITLQLHGERMGLDKELFFRDEGGNRKSLCIKRDNINCARLLNILAFLFEFFYQTLQVQKEQ